MARPRGLAGAGRPRSAAVFRQQVQAVLEFYRPGGASTLDHAPDQVIVGTNPLSFGMEILTAYLRSEFFANRPSGGAGDLGSIRADLSKKDTKRRIT